MGSQIAAQTAPRVEVSREVACREAIDEIQQTRRHHAPRRLKMQMPAPTVLVGQDETVAGRHRASRRRNRDLEQCLCVDVSHFPPIEARVGDDDLNAGYEQRQKAQSRNPMGDADDCGMPRPRRSGGRYCRIGHSWIISLPYYPHGLTTRTGLLPARAY